MPERLYSGPEARRLLGIRTEDFYAAVRTGRLRAVRLGRRNLKVSAGALEAFIRDLERERPAAPADGATPAPNAWRGAAVRP